MTKFWPLLLLIPPALWAVWYVERERRRALHEIFEAIRQRERVYELNEDGTAFVLKKEQDASH
jgi:hypothetical protein